MVSVLKSVCKFVSHVCTIQLTKQFFKIPLSLAFLPPRKKRNHKRAIIQQQPQTKPTVITSLDKEEGIVKTAPVQLSPYLPTQSSEMHLKVLTELTAVLAETISLKDYEDWKRSLLTGKKQMVHPSWKMTRRTIQGRQSIDLISVLRKIMELIVLELASGQRKMMIWNSIVLPSVWPRGLPFVMGWDLWMRGRHRGSPALTSARVLSSSVTPSLCHTLGGCTAGYIEKLRYQV